jgi:hypothetical protein
VQDRGRKLLYIIDETKGSGEQEYDIKDSVGVPVDNLRIKVDVDITVKWLLTGMKAYSSPEKVYADTPAKFWGDEIEKVKITFSASTHIEMRGSG